MDKLNAVDNNCQDPGCCTTNTVTSWLGKFIAMLMLFLIPAMSSFATNCHLIGVPDDVTVNCNEIPPVAVVTAECDGCNAIVSLTEVVSDKECSSQFTLTRIFTATDCSGNISVKNQVITVVDDTPITMDPAPSGLVLNCGDEIPAPAELTASGGCVQPFVRFSQKVNYDVQCPVVFEINRKWTAEDECGRKVVREQSIVVQDIEAPVASSDPEDVTIQCTDAVPAVPVVTFTDRCCAPTTWYDADTIRGNCPQAYTIVREWGAYDKCKNETIVRQIITVVDTIAPILSAVPECDTFECSTFELPAPVVTATDNCDNEVPVVTTRKKIEGDCVGEWEVRFIYVATDDCGNTTTDSTCYQFIDTTPPNIYGVPDDETINCEDYDKYELPEVTTDDNCCIPDMDKPVKTIIEGPCPQSYMVKWVWTSVDKCGNVAQDSFKLTVVDNEKPVLYGVPKDITVSCDDKFPGLPTVTATDNCDDNVVPVFSTETILGGCPQEYQVIRTWTATDDCGNTTSSSYIITVIDTIAPVIIPGPDQTVECMDNEEPGDIERGTVIPSPSWTASDNCDNGVIVDIDTNRVAFGCTYKVIYTFTASDSCGNEAIPVTQTITVIDTTAPIIFDVPVNATYQCDEDIPVQGDVNTFDACSKVTVTKWETYVPGNCPQEYQLIRYWTATDECDNSSEATQVITVVDTKAPVITIDPNTTVECIDDVVEPNYSAVDNCDKDPLTRISREDIDGSGCQMIVRFTVTSTDACGNTATAIQDVLVVDTTPPSIEFDGDLAYIGNGDTVYIECDTFINFQDHIKAEDNCCFDTIKFVETFLGDDGCTKKLLCEWTAYDCCGNDSTISMFMFITDRTAPEIVVPNDSKHECDELVPVGTATATDNCDDDITIQYLGADTIQGSCLGDFIVKRTWKAIDDCDNMATGVQTLYFTDNTPPVLTIPADFEAECDNLPDVEDYRDQVSAEDNCCFAPIVLAIDSEDDDCYGKILWIWSATDDCGNETIDTTVINIVDNTKPVITVGNDTTVQCNTEVPKPVFTVTDNCDKDIQGKVYSSTFPGQCPQEYEIVYYITAEDICGNVATAEWKVTVVDTEAPVLVGVPACDTFECSTFELPAPIVTAEDNCDDEVPVVVTRKKIEGDCVGRWTVRFIYTATDDCGNTTTDSTCYEFIDTTPPNIYGVPEDETVQCEDADEYGKFDVTTDDNCCIPDMDKPVKTIIPGDCPQSYTIQWVWTSVDKCGNIARDTFNLTVIDTQKPVIHGVPEDIVLECDDKLPGLPTVTATDNCDDDVVPVFESEIVPGACANTYVMTRKWTATDDCGNVSVASYTITVVDTTAPVIVPGKDIEVECADNEEPGDIERTTLIPSPEFTVTDNCDNPVEVDVDTARVAFGCTYQVIYTYNAVDDCGNVAETQTQTITVVDNTAPIIFDVPANASYSCDEEIPAQGDVNTFDACSKVTVVKEEIIVAGPCEGTYSIIRTWTAYDECDNSSQATQTINVSDIEKPVITMDPTATVECLSDVQKPNYTVVDNCDPDPTVNVKIDTIDGSGCQQIVRITVTATDWCKNTSSAIQDILVVDTTDPELSNPGPDITVKCGEKWEVPVLTAKDNCDDDVQIIGLKPVDVAGSCPQNYSVVYTWVALDECNNSDTATWTVNIVDEEAPVLKVPADSDHECDEVVPVGAATAEDNCDPDPTVIYLGADTTQGACLGDFTVTRTWKATDACGNESEKSQILNFTDNTPPVLTIPADFTAECDDVPNIADYQDQVSATDNCCFAPVTSRIVNENDDCYGKILWIFTATDDCGNSSTDTTVIDVVDNTKPVLDNAADLIPVIEIGCNDEVPTFTPEWSDNCDLDLELSAISGITPPGCSQSISRSWTAIDDCGNETTVSQVINIVDKEAPVLVGVPTEDLNLECGDQFTVPVVTASDDCADISGPVEPLIAIVDGICVNGYIYTWTVTDDCDNTTSASWTVLFRDTEAPVLTVETMPATVECLADVINPDYSAEDACTGAKVTVNKTIIEGSGCEQIVTVTITAVDSCGNDTTVEQTTVVRDNTDPVYPAATVSTEECGQKFLLPIPPVATDNCDDDLTYAESGPEKVTVSDCEYHLVYTYTATDDCGNQGTTTHTIKVLDTQAPELSVPGFQDGQTVDVECHEFVTPDASAADAFDACCLDTVTFVETLLSNDGCTQKLSCVWTATDCCGNESTFTIFMNVVDRTSPEITCPADIVIYSACDTVITWDPATATDNCQDPGDITITQAEGPASGSVFAPGTTIAVTYVADDGCGNTDVCSFTITVEDNTPEIIVDVDPGECEPVFDPGDCLATDMQFQDHHHAMILFDDLAYTDEAREYLWEGGTGMLSEFPDGTAHLSGTVYSVINPDRKWDVDVWFKSRRTYIEWIGLGRFIKANPANVSNTDQWRIYEMDDTKSFLYGNGAYFGGTTLKLKQKPTTLQFGFQIGHGGNSFDAHFGASTWFYYESLDGSFEGAGDFDIDLDCDLPTDPACDGTITVEVDGTGGPYTIEWMVNGASEPAYDGLTTLTDLCEGIYKVTVTDQWGCSWEEERELSCDVNKIDVDNIGSSNHNNGIIEPNRSGDRLLQAFPNPFTNKVSVNIESKKGETYRLVTFDAAGKVVFEEALFGTGEQIRKTIDLTNRGKGLYFISLQSESGITKEARVIKAE